MKLLMTKEGITWMIPACAKHKHTHTDTKHITTHTLPTHILKFTYILVYKCELAKRGGLCILAGMMLLASLYFSIIQEYLRCFFSLSFMSMVMPIPTLYPPPPTWCNKNSHLVLATQNQKSNKIETN